MRKKIAVIAVAGGIGLTGGMLIAPGIATAADNGSNSVSGRLGAINSAGLRDMELDRLIDAANHSSTPFQRLFSIRRAMDRVAALRAYLPLVVPNDAVLVSRRIAWEPPLDLGLRPADMSPGARTP